MLVASAASRRILINMTNTTSPAAETATIKLSTQDVEDARYALGVLANEDESKASACEMGSPMRARLLEQSERFRALARRLYA